jgi:hypothetical protein
MDGRRRRASLKTAILGCFGIFVLVEIKLAWSGSQRILASQSISIIDAVSWIQPSTAWWVAAPSSVSNSTSFRWNNSLASNFEIDHIYFFNSFVRPTSNQLMNEWLSLQDIPHFRIEAISGPNIGMCKDKARCLNERRAAFTYQYLARHGGLRNGITQGNNSFSKTRKEVTQDYPTAAHDVPSSLNVDIPFGDRPTHDTVKPYYNLSGTTMVIHEDDIHVPNMDHLRSAIALGMEQGLISSKNWEVIRLECCEDEPGAAIETAALSAADILVNRSWTIRKQTAGVLLWRDTALQIFGDRIFAPEHYNNFISVEYRIARDFYSYSLGNCLCRFRPAPPPGPNNSATEVSSSMLLTPLQRIDVPLETKISMERIQQEISLNKKNRKVESTSSRRKIDHVYYSNLKKNKIRRQSMDFWMNNDPLLAASHKRINATIGDPSIDQCVPTKNDPKRCRGLAGITRTLLGILDDENTTGLSLVLEDDYVITDPGLQRMEASLQLVPDDWDLIRFDCLQTEQVHLQWVNPFVVNTSTMKVKSECDRSVPNHKCWFCGGAFAMLWREESIAKLRAMWGRTPYDDVDCIVARTSSIRSYCVNVGVGDMFVIDSEVSDIPKVGD